MKFYPKKVLVIGYGNTLRSDDGAGQKVAETVEDWELPNVRSLAMHQLTPELAAELAVADAAVFVDVYSARQSEEVEVHCLLSNPKSKIEHPKSSLGHASDPRSLLSLTQTLYGYAPPTWWVLIPAVNFEFGEEFSPVTERGIVTALEHIQRLLSVDNS